MFENLTVLGIGAIPTYFTDAVQSKQAIQHEGNRYIVKSAKQIMSLYEPKRITYEVELVPEVK